jgi:hypothetical protein
MPVQNTIDVKCLVYTKYSSRSHVEIKKKKLTKMDYFTFTEYILKATDNNPFKI